MKKIIFIVLISALILSGCAKPADPLAGRSDKEVAACQLIQKFVVFYSADTEQASWVACEFVEGSVYFPTDDRWVAISPKPSSEHPNYHTYLRNVQYRKEQGIEAPASILLVDPSNQIIMDPGIADPQAGRFFRLGENDLFERPTTDEIKAIYGEEILNQ
ncbi:MAG: hypothetical protein ACOZBH_04380 [Patescibacteria group bacterium]